VIESSFFTIREVNQTVWSFAFVTSWLFIFVCYWIKILRIVPFCRAHLLCLLLFPSRCGSYQSLRPWAALSDRVLVLYYSRGESNGMVVRVCHKLALYFSLAKNPVNEDSKPACDIGCQGSWVPLLTKPLHLCCWFGVCLGTHCFQQVRKRLGHDDNNNKPNDREFFVVVLWFVSEAR
jgi:hypothetical protein